jgi:hypothetical protein
MRRYVSAVMPATNLSAVMPGHRRPKGGVPSHTYVPGIHVLAALQHQRRGWHCKSGLPDLCYKSGHDEGGLYARP